MKYIYKNVCVVHLLLLLLVVVVVVLYIYIYMYLSRHFMTKLYMLKGHFSVASKFWFIINAKIMHIMWEIRNA